MVSQKKSVLRVKERTSFEVSQIERKKSVFLTLSEVLNGFPSSYPHQKTLEQLGEHYGPDKVIVDPEAEEFLTRIKSGEPLSSKEMGRLHQILTSNLGVPSSHASAVYSKFSSARASRRTRTSRRYKR